MLKPWTYYHLSPCPSYFVISLKEMWREPRGHLCIYWTPTLTLLNYLIQQHCHNIINLFHYISTDHIFRHLYVQLIHCLINIYRSIFLRTSRLGQWNNFLFNICQALYNGSPLNWWNLMISSLSCIIHDGGKNQSKNSSINLTHEVMELVENTGSHNINSFINENVKVFIGLTLEICGRQWTKDTHK